MQKKSVYFHFLSLFLTYTIFLYFILIKYDISLDNKESILLVFINTLMVPLILTLFAEFFRTISKNITITIYAISTLTILMHHLLCATLKIGLANHYILEVMTNPRTMGEAGISWMSILIFIILSGIIIALHFFIDKIFAPSKIDIRITKKKVLISLLLLVAGFRILETEGSLIQYHLNQGKSLGQLLLTPSFFISKNDYFVPFKIEPAQPIVGTIKVKKNINLILIESLRADLFNKDNFPKTFDIIDKINCKNYSKHFSSGHETSNGLYGLLYGEDAIFYHASDNQKINSKYLNYLKENNYKLNAITSSNIFFWMDAAFMFKPFHNLHDVSEEEPLKRDQSAIEQFFKYQKMKDSINFNFLFLNTTHFPYIYPTQYEIHKPILLPNFIPEQLSLDSDTIVKVKNRYLNALGFLDHQIEQILTNVDVLSEKNITIMTGDHGEALGELNYIGHINPSFSNELVKVPLLICGGNYLMNGPLTSHKEIFPFLLKELGVVEHYDSQSFKTITAVGTPFRSDLMAFITDDKKYIFRLTGRQLTDAHLVQLRDKSDNRLEKENIPHDFENLKNKFINQIKTRIIE